VGDDRILVQVPAEDLPPSAQALLDSGIPRPAGSRFLVRRTRVIWIPALWLAGLLAVGIASLRATVTAGLNPDAGAERLIYGAMTAVCLVGAIVSARKMLQGLAERRDVRRGAHRQGLHVLGMEGLLIAGRDRHTWVPRELLPPAAEVSGPASGGDSVPSYAYFIVDGENRMERLDCGILTKTALWMWAEHGELPEGSGWT